MKHYITFLLCMMLFFATNTQVQAGYAGSPGFPTTSVAAESPKSSPNFWHKTQNWVKKLVEDDGKTAAIVGYIGILGWLISYFAIHKASPTGFSEFHLRQAFGNGIMAIASWVLLIIPIIGWITILVITILALINMITGIINSVNGVEKPVPIFGKLFAKMFQNMK